jgi:eukaryotic-like serine/threonine-protein kinase
MNTQALPQLAPGSKLADRYDLEASLGQGGMGTVFRARDVLLDRAVAVKVLNDQGTTGQSQARMLREAQTAARLNHPGIVSVYDAGEVQGVPYIVMELVEGPSVHEQRPESMAEIIEVARQVCAALEHAHANGIIHRDLKPENVLLAPDGTAKLTDFGLARSAASRLTSEGSLVGTVFYLAPEQALGREVDSRSDLYSLGVMLYELVAGRLPFMADDPVAVISQHLLAPPVPPSTYNPELPPALEDLILRLMSKEPEHRPASAAEVRRAIEALGQGLAAGAPAGDSAVLAIDRLARGRLVARENEMAQARALWQEAAGGEGQVLLVSGEPGIGKTRFTRELSTYAEVTGGRVLSAECYAEGGPPYAPLAHIILAALAGAPADDPGVGLPPLVLADLVTIAPALAARFPGLPPNPPLDPQAEQQRLFGSVLALVESLAAASPLLWVIDDAHWSDSASLLLLRHIARRGRRLRLMLALNYREVGLDEAHALRDVLTDLNRERLATRIKLARFEREQARELLEQLFRENITDDFLDSIYRETEGNPFYVEEVCKALIEEGRLQRQGGRWVRAPSDEWLVPQSVRLAIQGRVSKLPAEAQDVLRVAAILGREFDFETLQRASEQSEDALVDALETAERAQLIGEVRRAGRETYAFAHALIPATMREGVSGVRRHRLHRRAAAAVEAVRPDDFEVLAYHYAEAGDEAQARANYVRAAERSARLYANEDAIRLYTEALAMCEEDEAASFDLLMARARVYDLLGRRSEQRADIDAMLATAERLHDDARRCDALLVLADYMQVTAWLGAEEPAQQAAALARQLHDPVREGHALRRLGMAAWARHDHVASRQQLETAVARFREAGMPAETAACLHTLSLAVRDLGDYQAALAIAEEAMALSRQAGGRREEANGLRRMAIILHIQFRHAEALAHVERALAVHQQIGDRQNEISGLSLLGDVLFWLGRNEAARKTWERLLEASQPVQSGMGVTNAVTYLFWITVAVEDDYQKAFDLVDGYLADPDCYKDALVTVQLNAKKAAAMADIGQYDEALRIIDEGATALVGRLHASVQADVACFKSYCYAEVGRPEQAAREMEAAFEFARQSDDPLAQLPLWAQKAHLALGAADGPGAAQAVLRDGLQAAQRGLSLLTDRTAHSVDMECKLRLVASRLSLALSQREAGLAHASEALRLIEIMPYATRREDTYFVHAQALAANGRAAEAASSLRRAWEQMMRTASKFTDRALRASWLENVPIHRAIAHAWRAQAADPS